jgi:hypothetical protein
MRKPLIWQPPPERITEMRNPWHLSAALVALITCALLAAGCGGGSDTTNETTSVGANAQQKIDSAVNSCTQEAQQVGGSAGSSLEGACQLVGASAKQAVQSGGAKAKQALSQAADSCRSAVSQLPSNQAQDALKQLCDAIDAAA